jgi:hypothetical protein
MPPGPGRSTYVFRSEAPLWTRSFLERVAEALARAPSEHSILVEHLDGTRLPTITCARADFESTLQGAARSLPGKLVPVARPVRSAASWDRTTLVGFLTARALGAESTDRKVASEPRPPSIEAPLDDSLGVDVQTYWFPDPSGRLRVWTRFAAPWAGSHEGVLLRGGLELAHRVAEKGGPLADVRIERRGPGAAREWSSGRLGRLRSGPPLRVDPITAASAVPLAGRAPSEASDPVRHTVVLGATGSGKTGLVAALAAERISRGTPVLLFDVHGDLAPAVVARLVPSDRSRVLAIDAADPHGRIPGLAILEPGPGPSADAGAADVVAALKRLSSEGGETYWGFRLERIFDTFVRVVQDERGSLLDLLALLTDERRRESARLTTRRPDAARFLEELPAILRRSPEFLWPAASRLSKIALVPALAALLAPADGGLPIEEWVGRGGSILWRLPFSHLGPEGATLAGTLLATRSYLALARSPVRSCKRLRALFVVDEAHAFSSRLLTEMLAEGRKFGIGVVVASQYPERLDPELRAAAAGAAGTHIVFRVPPAAARDVGEWIGLEPAVARDLLPALPVGKALAVASGETARFLVGEPLAHDSGATWASRVDATSAAYFDDAETVLRGESEEIGDTILLELVAWGGAPGASDEATVVETLAAREIDPIDRESARRELDLLVGRGWIEREGGRLRASPAGARRLGIGASTGAVSESAEHRALLIEALRIFARHGLRLEILRQGRFDTRLPDAVVAIVPRLPPEASPEVVWSSLAARRSTWAWRFFRGRNVHVEAEVSGAERRERIRRGLAKAERRGAFALFLVSDTRRARRVRGVLVDAGAFPDRAQVWMLPRARAAR